MNLLQQIGDHIQARANFAWHSARAQIPFRPRLWMVKTLECRLNGQALKYVGAVVSGFIPDDLIKASGFSFEGAGTAARNAFFEYLEILSCQKNGITSEMTRSGCATSTNFEDARRRAWCELVERDSFLLHFICAEVKSFPIEVPNELSMKNVKLVQLQSVDPDVIVVLALTIKDRWACMGLGTGVSVRQAVTKACMECEMLANEWSIPEDLSMATPRLKSFLPHWQAASSEAGQKKIQNIINGGGDKILYTRHSLAGSKLKFCEIYPKGTDLNSASCITLLISHNELIPFSIGKTWVDDRDKVMQIISSRGFQGEWSIHPFL